MPDATQLATIIGIAVGGLAALGALAAALRKLWTFLRRVGYFLDDWMGEPQRGAMEARPGVLERLDKIEHEVKLNNGSSLKDAVRRIERRLGDGPPTS